jgi:NitT/TauT family transport system permease protein
MPADRDTTPEVEGDLTRQLQRYTPLLLGILSFVIILSVWELSVRLGWVNPFFTSNPFAIADALRHQVITGELLLNLSVSLVEFAVGLGLAVVIGVLLGLFIGWYRIVDYALDPFVWFLYSAPLVAFYPIFIIVVGLGKPTVIAITFLLSVIVILVNTAAGIRNVDPLLLQVSRSFGARKYEIFFKVALPASVPMMIAGLRLAVGRALMGIVAAEMFGSTAGLGASISYYGGLLKTTNMLASLVIITGLGVLLTQGLALLEGRFDSWRIAPGK